MQRVVNYIIIFLIILGAGLVSGLILLNVGFNTKEVYVPDVLGLDSLTALKTLNNAELSMVVVGQEHSPAVAENHVISQEPGAGSKVKKNKRIRTVLSLGGKQMTAPDMVGVSLREAKIALSQRGLNLKRITTIYDEANPGDVVIAQNPPQGQTLENGEEISLLVSAGSRPESYIMPDLTGKDFQEVARFLEEIGIEVGEIKYKEYKGSYPGQVMKQEPIAGYKIARGDKVGLTLAKEMTGAAPNTGSFAVLRYRLPQEGAPGKVKIIVENESGAKEVFNAVREPGTEVQVMVKIEGETVAKVYFNGELVHQQRF